MSSSSVQGYIDALLDAEQNADDIREACARKREDIERLKSDLLGLETERIAADKVIRDLRERIRVAAATVPFDQYIENVDQYLKPCKGKRTPLNLTAFRF